MIKYILLSLTLISSPLLADSLYLGGFSKHLFTKGLNENNPLLAVEINDYVIGGFKNSYNDFTILTARDFKIKTNGNLSAGVILGATYGYYCDYVPLCKDKFMPVLSPYISFTKYNIQPTVLLFGEAVYFTVKINY